MNPRSPRRCTQFRSLEASYALLPGNAPPVGLDEHIHKHLIAAPTNRLLCVGHSLGASVASIAALVYAHTFPSQARLLPADHLPRLRPLLHRNGAGAALCQCLLPGLHLC